MQDNNEEFDIRALRLMLLTAQTQSLSKSAAALDMSTASASKLLSKLKEQFENPLFVRSGGRLVPTPRAGMLVKEIEPIIHAVDMLARDREPFNPSKTSATIRLAAIDNAAMMLYQDVFADLMKRAPNLRFEIESLDGATFDRLRDGRIDLALMADQIPTSSTFHSAKLIESNCVMLVSRNHPLVEAARVRRLDESDVAPYRRIGVSLRYPSHPTPHTELGPRYSDGNVAITMPNYMAAANFASRTNLLLAAPKDVAEVVCEHVPLAMLEDPIYGSEIWSSSMVWHERTHTCPMLQWVRANILCGIRDKKLREKAQAMLEDENSSCAGCTDDWIQSN